MQKILKSYKELIIGIYITLIIPMTTTYLLPLLQGIILGVDKSYYKKTSLIYTNYAVIIISIALLISTYFICSKQLYEIFYYMLGIITCFIMQIFPIKSSALDFPAINLKYILIIGYIILLSILFISIQIIKWKNISKSDHRIKKPN